MKIIKCNKFIKSMTDNSIDMFDEIEKLCNKYLTQGEDYDRE